MLWNDCPHTQPLVADHPLQNITDNWPDEPTLQFAGRQCRVLHRMDQGFTFPNGLANNGVIISSPENIIHCFNAGHYAGGVCLVSSWGTMGRTMPLRRGPAIINRHLIAAVESIKETSSAEDAWGILTGDVDDESLHWTDTMASKVLHFLCRAIFPADNDHPVPIDGAVIVNTVWPQWAAHAHLTIVQQRPLKWRSNRSWAAYNRYMTAIRHCAASLGWSTIQFESTLFALHR
mgnify:CR=1 FL=1